MLKHKTPSSFSGLTTARAEINPTRALPVIARVLFRSLRSSRTSCRDGDAVRPPRVCKQLVAVPVAKSDSPKLAVKDRLDSIAYPSSIYALNMCSLAKAHAKDQLHADLLNYNIDIAIISETHLKRHHKDEIFAIDGYHLFRRDRIGRRNGGVAYTPNISYLPKFALSPVIDLSLSCFGSGSMLRESLQSWVRCTILRHRYIQSLTSWITSRHH